MPKEYINLGEAIKLVQEKHPWIATSTLRQAVSEGKIPFIRGSANPKARYYVKLTDLSAYVDGLPREGTIQ